MAVPSARRRNPASTASRAAGIVSNSRTSCSVRNSAIQFPLLIRHLDFTAGPGRTSLRASAAMLLRSTHRDAFAPDDGLHHPIFRHLLASHPSLAKFELAVSAELPRRSYGDG